MSGGQGELLGFISLPNLSCRGRRLETKSSDIRGRDRSKQSQPKRRQGRQSDFGTVGAKSCINPRSDTSNPDTDEVAIGRSTHPFGSDRNHPVKLSATLDFHRQRNPARCGKPILSKPHQWAKGSLVGTISGTDVTGRLSMHLDRPADCSGRPTLRRSPAGFATAG